MLNLKMFLLNYKLLFSFGEVMIPEQKNHVLMTKLYWCIDVPLEDHPRPKSDPQ